MSWGWTSRPRSPASTSRTRGISNFGDDLQPAVVFEGPGNRPAVAAVKDPEDAA